jgi:hypothetical protein
LNLFHLINESLVFVFDLAITSQLCVPFLIRSFLQVIVNRVSPKRSLNHGHRFAVRSHPSCQLWHSDLSSPQVRGEEFSLLRDATHVVCDSTQTLDPIAAMLGLCS